MEKLLTEELLKQLSLIKYDRSKTLLEQTEIPTVKSDRLGGDDPDFNADPKIFSDPSYIEYEKLSPEKKEKLDQEQLDKYWKPRLCTKTADQRRSVLMDGKYESHEEVCKPFGGTKIYRSESEGVRFIDVTEKDMFGQAYFCGCKYDRQIILKDGRNISINDYISDLTTKSLYEVEDFLGNPHNVLTLGAVALAIFGGPIGMAAAAALDGLSAALYFEEGDYFMGGLSLIFLLIPVKQLLKAYLIKNPGAKEFTKKTLTTILEKIRLKKPLEKIEKKIIEAFNNPNLLNVAYRRLLMMKFKQLILGKSPSYIVSLFVWLVEKGYMVSKFLFKFGITVGGIFYSWYKIAGWLGIKQKGEGAENEKISESDIIEGNVLSLLRVMEEKKYTYSTKISGSDFPQVAALQYALYAGGYFENNNSPRYQVTNGILKFTSSKDVKNVKVYNSTGRLMDDINNTSNDFSSKNKLDKGVYILKITYKNGKSESKKLNYLGSGYEAYNFGTISPLTAKWGFYDNDTKIAVENYQKANGLYTVDGVAGNDTLKSIISNIENDKIKNFLTVHKFSNYDFNKYAIINNSTEGLTKEIFEKAYEEQKEKIIDSLYIANDQKYIKINGDSLFTVFSDADNIKEVNYPEDK